MYFKVFSSISIFTLLSIYCSAQIRFFNGTLPDAIREAKDKNKVVFIDGYTTWCAPCKWMDKNVFESAKTGNYFNAHFVNLKMDMESPAGQRLAQKHSISGYPSFIFLNQNGEFLHKSFGAREINEFIQLGIDALDDNRQLSFYQKEYETNRYDPDFLFGYANALKKASQPNSRQIADDYLATQMDWSSEQNSRFILKFLNFDLHNEKFIYLIHHRHDFYKHIDKAIVDQKIINIILGNLGPNPDGDELHMLLKNAFQGDRIQSVDKLKLEQLALSDKPLDQQLYVELAIDYFETYLEIDAVDLNNMAWYLYEKSSNPKALRIAQLMALESVEKQPMFENYDTLAYLQFALNQLKDAEASALMAVKLAQESGASYKNTQELIWRIRKKSKS